MIARRWVRVGWLTAAVMLGGCPDEDGDERPLLIVRAASSQPREDSSGMTVVIQAFGGDRLAVRTEKGTHAFQSSPERRATSCLAIDASSLTPLQMQVFSTEAEPLVFVDLRAGNGAQYGGLDEPCSGETLETRVVALGDAIALPPDARAEGEQHDAQ